MARLDAFHTAGRIEAGCDEAGRGCLAGPVVAAAVILPPRVRLPGLDDSKKLSAAAREALRPLIEQRAVAWAVASASPEEVDRINILNASFLAMHRAIDALAQRPQHLLIDGNRFKRYADLPHTCVVQGDGRYRAIAAASVLAKTHRDALMLHAHAEHPAYGWDRNMGYPTAEHRAAIRTHGITALHRRTFTLLKEEAVLF
jgi:ribonuclease HII